MSVHPPRRRSRRRACRSVPLGLTACGANDAQPGRRRRRRRWQRQQVIALLLPESKTTRYEAFDKPLFEAKVAELCDDCEVVYYNADQDEAKQTAAGRHRAHRGRQRRSCSTRSTARAPAAWSTSAQDAGVPVIAYDRFIAEADYYMSFDNETVGKLQARGARRGDGRRGRHPDAQRLARATPTPRSSRPARTACSTPAASRSSRSTTTPTGARRTRRSSSPTS